MLKRIGTVSVDSGTVWVSDPAYADKKVMGKASEALLEGYGQAQIKSVQFLIEHGHHACEGEVEPPPDGVQSGFGVLVTGFGGDGDYPCYVEMEGTEVTKLIVDFRP